MSDTRPRSTKVAGIARHGRLSRPSIAGAIFKGFALALAVVLVSGVSVAAIAAWDLSRQIQTFALPGQTDGPIPEIGAIEGGVNFLLVGSDSRANAVNSFGEDPESELNDVTMLLHISQDHTNAEVISFPRDMAVPIPECPDPSGGTFSSMSSQKINTTLAYGGVACTVATVSALTGLDIPFAAKITFDGVIEMSNAIGGVPVCVAEPIEDEHTELYLDAGTHTLQGVDALKFLRTRYGVGDGSDLTRISSQQVFLSSLVRQVKDSATLTDITKLYGLAGASVRNMEFSESLNNVDTLVQIAKALAPIDLAKITFVQYPTFSGSDGVRPNYDAADVLFAAVAADQSVALTPTDSGGEVGSVVDPNAPVAVPTEAPVPDPAATDAPVTTAPPTTVLPSGVLGQTAADYTCSVGRTLDDQ